VLAVTKCDLLDDELIEMLRDDLLSTDSTTPIVFISAVTGYGLDELKDVLWDEMNAESNKLAAVTTTENIAHRDKDMSRFAEELADEGEDEDIEYVDADDVEDFDDVDELEDFEYEE
jgi:GTP-binding protein